MTRSTTPIPTWAAETAAHLPPLATPREVAELLRIAPRTLKRWRSRGKIRAVRTGVGGSARVLFARTEVARLLAELVAQPPSDPI